MKKPGRKSAAQLSVVPVPPTVLPRRPTPPKRLNADEAEIWQVVLSSRPADFYLDSLDLVECYCHAVVQERVINRLIDDAQPKAPTDENLAAWMRFTRLSHSHTRSLTNLARALRVTPSARYGPRTVERSMTDPRSSARRPWELEEG